MKELLHFSLYSVCMLLFATALSFLSEFIVVRLLGRRKIAENTPSRNKTLLIAHRGYSAKFPENSLQSFENAISLGADGIELDVRLTKDGRVVCCHDAKVHIIGSHKKEIVEETVASEICCIVNDEGIRLHPFLEEVFELCSQRIGIVLLDVKTPSAKIIQQIFEIGKSFPVMGQVVIGVRNHEQLAEVVRAQEKSGCKVQGILGFWPDPDDYKTFFNNGGTIFRLWEGDVTEHRTKAIHDLGHPLWVCSGTPEGNIKPGDINGPSLRKMKNTAVDAVLVNDPVSARKMLSKWWSCL